MVGALSSRRSFSDILNEGDHPEPDGKNLRIQSIVPKRDKMYMHLHDTIIEEGKENELCNSSSIAFLEDKGTENNSKKDGDETSGRVLRESNSRNIAST